jgi:hypothetical protein
MLQFAIKVIISALLIVGIAEAGKRLPVLGAVLASLPLVSLLGMFWLYYDTRDARQVAGLAYGIFWLVIPSLLLFILLPVLINRGVAFAPALAVSAAVTIGGYFLMLYLLGLAGVKI